MHLNKMKPALVLVPILFLSAALRLGAHPGPHSPPGPNDDIVAIHKHAMDVQYGGSGLYQMGGSAGTVVNYGKDIVLYNTAYPWELPSATFEHAWAYMSGHYINYGDSTVIISTAGQTDTFGYGGRPGPANMMIDPLIHGWSGVAILTVVHKSGVVLENHTASWDFGAPRCPTCVSSCPVKASIGSVHFEAPLGSTSFGNDANILYYESEDTTNLGVAGIKFRGHTGNSGSLLFNRPDGSLSSVTTGNTVVNITETPSSADPKKFSILYTYINDPRPSPPSPVFREITVENHSGGLLISDTSEGVTRTQRFTHGIENGVDVWTLNEDDLRRSRRLTLLDEGIDGEELGDLRVFDFTVEEKALSGDWVATSTIRQHEKKFSWGWETVKSVRDPHGVAATTSFDFYVNSGEYSLSKGKQLGRLKEEIFPSGFERHFEYYKTDEEYPEFNERDVVIEHFGSAPGGLERRIHRRKEQLPIGTVYTLLEEEWVSGTRVSKKETVTSPSGSTEKVYTGANQAPLTTFTSFTPAGRETRRPDGTVERVARGGTGDEGVEVISVGVRNPVAGTFLLRGEESVTVRSRTGALKESTRYQVHDGVAYREEKKVVAVKDHLERPTRVDVFFGNATTASYSEVTDYSCCGVASETGRDGITTHHYYDTLGRKRKSHKNGVSVETVRDGLTTRTHRYAESTANPTSGATASNEWFSETRNPAGSITGWRERSPKDGAMVETTTATSFDHGNGVGTRIIWTLPGTADDNSVVPRLVQDYYPDGKLKSRTGSLVADRSYQYSINSQGITKSASLLTSAGQAFETEVTQHDWAGRLLSVTYAGDKDGDNQPDQSTFTYDSFGRISSAKDPDGVTNLFQENPETGQSIFAVDVNENGVIDLAVDRVSLVRAGFGLDSNSNPIGWSETASRGPGGAGQSTEKLLSREEWSLDGLSHQSRINGDSSTATVSTSTQFQAGVAGAWSTTTVRADGTSSVERYEQGFLSELKEYASNGTLLATQGLTRDNLRRVSGITDSRGPGTSYQYVSLMVDQMASITTAGHVTGLSYDERGRLQSRDEDDTLDSVGNPVANTRYFDYYVDGSVREESGTPGYRVTYTYNDALRLDTLTTYGTNPSVTRWEYDADRGWLLTKRHNSSGPGLGAGETYAYTAGGRLDVRTLARGVTVSHAYDSAGTLARKDYSDGTPSLVIHERDQMGRVKSLTDGAGKRNLSYDGWGALDGEAYQTGSLLAGWHVRQDRDAIGRLSGLGVGNGATGISSHYVGYGYDNAGRVNTVTSPAGRSASYSYNPVHHGLEQVALSSGSSPVLYGTLQYDTELRLKRISYHNGQLSSGFEAFSDHAYTRDNVGRLLTDTAADQSRELYGYHPSGEIAFAKQKQSATGSDYLAGRSFEWTYDGIGNRLSASRGGDTSGANLRSTTYGAAPANLPSTAANPGAFDVTGVASAATVTVNGSSASRQGDYFHEEAAVTNNTGPATSPVWEPVNVIAGTDERHGNITVPPASQNFVHDADGNLLEDGTWHYEWDAENRLIGVETLTSATDAGIPYQRVEYTYDSDWRRVKRTRFDQQSSTTPVEEQRYLWAGWRCLAELNAAGAIVKQMAWGLDQNQQLHLGDGNGALLWTDDVAGETTDFLQYDGNGNVVGLSDATGALTAEYRYGAFGELLAIRGSRAGDNLYRHSTKPFEEIGQLYNYGYRQYDPVNGRWLSRDPLGEAGGIHLNGFLGNDPVNRNDELGLSWLGDRVQDATNWANNHVGAITSAWSGASAAIAGWAIGSAPTTAHAGAALMAEYEAQEALKMLARTAALGAVDGVGTACLGSIAESLLENGGFLANTPPELWDELFVFVPPRPVNLKAEAAKGAIYAVVGGGILKTVGPAASKVKIPLPDLSKFKPSNWGNWKLPLDRTYLPFFPPLPKYVVPSKTTLALPAPKDFIDVTGVRDLASRIPSNANRLPWKTIPGGAEQGIKWKWTDAAGNKWQVRAHSLDPGAPAGSNAANGWIYRVEVNPSQTGGTWYMDGNGTFWKQNTLNPDSPHFVPGAPNDTHIPFSPR